MNCDETARGSVTVGPAPMQLAPAGLPPEVLVDALPVDVPPPLADADAPVPPPPLVDVENVDVLPLELAVVPCVSPELEAVPERPPEEEPVDPPLAFDLGKPELLFPEHAAASANRPERNGIPTIFFMLIKVSAASRFDLVFRERLDVLLRATGGRTAAARHKSGPAASRSRRGSSTGHWGSQSN